MHVNQDKYICVYIQMYLCMPLVGLHTYVYKESVKWVKGFHSLFTLISVELVLFFKNDHIVYMHTNMDSEKKKIDKTTLVKSYS